MDKILIQKMAEEAGFSWLTVADYGDKLANFAKLVARAEREECAKLCEKHYAEPQILRATAIDENPFRSAALDCAELIRSRGLLSR